MGLTVMIFIPRLTACLAIAVADFAFVGTAPVRAEGPVVVNPSRPGIPVVIAECDASYAVVFGDWGLSRPGAAPATVIGCPPDTPNEVYRKRNRYYPKTGHPPKLGRHEVEPSLDRELPKPAESFSRSWKAKKKREVFRCYGNKVASVHFRAQAQERSSYRLKQRRRKGPSMSELVIRWRNRPAAG